MNMKKSIISLASVLCLCSSLVLVSYADSTSTVKASRDTEQSFEMSTSGYENCVSFDELNAYSVFYESVSSNNPELKHDQLVSIVNELVAAAKDAHNQAINNANSENENSIAEVTTIELGRIADGQVYTNGNADSLTTTISYTEPSLPAARASIPYTEYIAIDSRTSIINHGFSVQPHQTSSRRWMTYGAWYGLDHYTSEYYGYWNCTNPYTVSKKLGYSGTLYSSDAQKYGLLVSPSTTYKASVGTKDNFQVSPWSARFIRAMIHWNKSDYSAQYEYYCYNATENSYSYKYVNLAGENLQYIDHGVQVWTATNSRKDPSAKCPDRPDGYWVG